MPDTYRASIVINNFNYGRFLADAIESALAQTHTNTEVIVVDDGSSDDSREIMRCFGEQVRCLLKENGGQASAYNAGFAASRGDIVCFLDADDTLFETTIAQATSVFRERPRVKVEWQLQIVDKCGAPSGEVVPAKPMPNRDLRQLSISDGPLYDWWLTPPSSGNSYSRSFLQRVLPMPEPPFRHGADVYLTILAPIYGPIHRLSGQLGTYRVHENNNYFGRTLDAHRLQNYAHRFENCCCELQRHLADQGVHADIEDWRKKNFNYLWPTRLLKAMSDLQTIVPPSGDFILVDDDEWGTAAPVNAARAIPLVGVDRDSWERPTNDAAAIEALEMQRRRGATLIVFWWTCFWWLEHYPSFARHLFSRFPCILRNDRLIAFDLTKEVAASVAAEAAGAI